MPVDSPDPPAQLETQLETRLESLFDDRSLRPIGGEDGTLAATGLVDGLKAVAFVRLGTMGAAGCEAVVRAYDLAVRERLPVVGLWRSGGARVAEGIESLHGAGRIFAAMTHASGVVPQISVVSGTAAGGAAYGPALTDIVIASEGGRVFVPGADVVHAGGYDDPATAPPAKPGKPGGVVHVVAKTDAGALTVARRITALLGRQGRVMPEEVADADLGGVLPDDPRRAYDVKPIVAGLLDDGCEPVELQPKWAPNITTTLGRLGGRTVGVIANNPIRLGGCLDSASAEKAARFVRMCDSFGVPLVVIVDVPGYLPGVAQEHDGVVRRGAKLLHAFAEAVVPRVTLVTRKDYGGAYIAMNSRALGATRVFAWPSADGLAVMGAVAAVRVLHRRELAAATEEERPAVERRLVAEHEKIAGGLRRAQDSGVVDEVVEPARTRRAIALAIAGAAPARGAHRNIPL
ncbi:carboxyl transferase domain-containing protein [Spongiactinospora sp. TRM90649]|uniref:acyl-CoA carboxylase subunit beta n=1 Tax=Spongiactinospora sp. TRM90649 TaxID=3031114 RepID=UPI0023F6AE58|nr:carboxyl transferase domain-containing protein [Spongiactinospora sp. TRM90649]MDF5758887.1 carboxyl transferase domain-containing protein [Spongiactinospora sp. TRM90649]